MLLSSNGDMGACWVGAEQQWRHGCVRASNGDMGACWMGAEQQWRHGCVLASHGDMGVWLVGAEQTNCIEVISFSVCANSFSVVQIALCRAHSP